MTASPARRLVARTVDLGECGWESLLAVLPADADPRSVLCWVREGEGLVGWGRAATCPVSGADRFDAAEAWWQDVVAGADVEDAVRLPGTGLVAFGSFSFSPASGDGGGLVVPEVLVGLRGGRAWATTVHAVGEAAPAGPFDHLGWAAERPAADGPAAAAPTPTAGLTVREGAVTAADWPGVVTAAIRRITAGEVDKVVLARDVVVESPGTVDVHGLLDRLARRYTATWTFAVDGLVGATPEMLVRLQHGQVRSRVLAGTVRRDQQPGPSVTEAHPELEAPHRTDPRIRLVSSDKDVDEHAFAVRSVAEALGPHCTELLVPNQPFVLELPDVYHLATDLTGTLRDEATSLRLAAALHPSAAVCGTPQRAAAAVIADLEHMDRGRYAGPVGWLDATGDGDWAIALRCGQLQRDGRTMRLFAGGGIVAASDPDAELAETDVKLAAMRHALGL